MIIKWFYGSNISNNIKFPTYLTPAKENDENLMALDAFLNKKILYEESNKLISIKDSKEKYMILPHQIQTAYKVINDMHARAILADEVGLGKTVEAGIIIKELYLRGLIKKILILVPAALAVQWQLEMWEKFDMKFTFSRNEINLNNPMQIQTYARFRNNINIYRSAKWDMVVVDEAHHLKNPETMIYNSVKSLFFKYILLLSATPVQNNVKELYGTVDLVKPGLFRDYNWFVNNFVEPGFNGRKLRQDSIGTMQNMLSNVIVRNRRSEVGLELTKRITATEKYKMDKPMDELYQIISEDIKNLTKGKFIPKILSITIIQMLNASPYTFYNMISNSETKLELPKDVLQKWNALFKSTRRPSQKAKHIVELVKKFLDMDKHQKVVVFATYYEFVSDLCEAFKESEINSVIFSGRLNSDGKKEAIMKFKEECQVMITTSSGSEGLNLQFANVVINADLPWNPMVIEQRIGRVHRIGQIRPVYVVNVVDVDTIDEYIVDILYTKIQLFESTIGEVSSLLSEVSVDEAIDESIYNAWIESSSKVDFKKKLEEMAWKITNKKQTMEQLSFFNDNVFSNFKLSADK